jgi:hypothetical protein
MKLNKRTVAFFLSALFITCLLASCASEPKLGDATILQQVLNELPSIPIAGKDLHFEFGGDTWIAKVDNEDYMAGTFTSEDTAEGSILTLNQTHIYSKEQKPGISGDIGWVKTPGPQIVLEYKKGPPETLSVK